MLVLDLFSGIGAFSLGLERAGLRTAAFCEIDPFCRRVLAKHWPEVPCYDDVRALTADRLASDDIRPIDVICGGFPCQDISTAGRGAGIGGERSGLWSEFARLIGELRPRYAIVENVAALLGRGLGVVLGDLAALGYDAEWHCIPASAVGAPHRRDRVWIVAYAQRAERWPQPSRMDGRPDRHDGGWPQAAGGFADGGSHVANADRPRLEGRLRAILSERAGQRAARSGDPPMADASGADEQGRPEGPRWRIGGAGNDPQERGRGYCQADVQWLAEPDVGRVADGIANRVDRLRSLGNALVPQIPEMIGRAIMEHG